ncbi:hypothetical protein [Risungbinella massiliensis]|uniref:hypothetical protein n=1 Tax=Risungbinella massiliensis TaxID=1329796 RepID=UPI0012B59D86|nr:hypothetical protein [Risungbinella massiliensis]
MQKPSSFRNASFMGLFEYKQSYKFITVGGQPYAGTVSKRKRTIKTIPYKGNKDLEAI